MPALPSAPSPSLTAAAVVCPVRPMARAFAPPTLANSSRPSCTSSPSSPFSSPSVIPKSPAPTSLSSSFAFSSKSLAAASPLNSRILSFASLNPCAKPCRTLPLNFPEPSNSPAFATPSVPYIRNTKTISTPEWTPPPLLLPLEKPPPNLPLLLRKPLTRLALPLPQMQAQTQAPAILRQTLPSSSISSSRDARSPLASLLEMWTRSTTSSNATSTRTNPRR